MSPMSPPPPPLVSSLVHGPSIVTDMQWFARCDSTNAIAVRQTSGGAAQGLLVVADEQSAGRGRHGRSWVAPAGTSLLFSLVLRPVTPVTTHALLPLLTALVLAETVERHLPDFDVALKWPNDLLVTGRKAAGILVEGVNGAVIVGVGVNVDWREVHRPDELRDSTSLAEVAGRDVDRWRLLAGLIGIFSRRYEQWQELPADFLDSYRRRCATLGRRVRVERGWRGTMLQGLATDVDSSGALLVQSRDGQTVAVHTGDVHHLRPAD
ncbi:MAG: biotin--[acetyl-CoA-carboxylase] ligase [Nitriliruptorales bacterium]|nr:biotin--[acetyl-CoA-carboxylase] ligase [Nitriliruptorales bacterium]